MIMNGIEDNIDHDSICRVRLSKEINVCAPTLITDFTNGRINSDKVGELKFECFKRENDRHENIRDSNRILMANNGRLNFRGESEQTAIRYFVAVRNKNKGRMKVFDTILFHMKPLIECKSVENIGSKTPQTNREKMDDLTQNFGNKSKKRVVIARMKNAVDVEERTGPDESLLLETKPEMTKCSQISYFPTQNSDAEEAKDVYDISEIISEEEEFALEKEIKMLMTLSDSGFQQKKLIFCNYVNEHLNDDVSSIVPNEKLKYLLYYNYMIMLHNLNYGDLRKRNVAPLIPQLFQERLLQNFTLFSKTSDGKLNRTFPTQLKDKLVSYILVLALFIDNFQVNLNSVLKDLPKVRMTKFVTISKALGCHVSEKTENDMTSTFATLKLPLFVMTTKYRKKRVN